MFDKISKNGVLDWNKLQQLCDNEMKEFGPVVFQIIKKHFSLVKVTFDFRSYVAQVNKFYNFDLNTLKEMFFNIIDNNKDKNVCESDLFKFMSTVKNSDYFYLVQDDILILNQRIEKKRLFERKDDEIALKTNLMMENVEKAYENCKMVEKVDH